VAHRRDPWRWLAKKQIFSIAKMSGVRQADPRMDISPQVLWFLLGSLLIIVEFTLPGIVLVFFGVGAWITAFTTWIGLTPGLPAQNLVFCISSLSLLFLLRNRLKKIFVGNSSNDEIEDEYTGKEVLVLSDISDSHGKVEIKGTEWNARSETPISATSLAIVERREGLTLHVRPR
jgi:membrane protein implicated in regulation of membrane protease activity